MDCRAARAHRRGGPGGVPGLRRRQLRATVADHQPARHGQRHAQGRDTQRRRAFGRRLGSGALVVAHHAPSARPPRRQRHRPPAAGQFPLRSTRRAHPTRPRHPPQARATADILGAEVYQRFPWAHYDCGGATRFALPTTTDPLQALLKRTWEPTLSVTGAEGFPALQDAGNVLRPYTAFKLSLRLPPLVDAALAVQKLKALLEDNAPYQAKVTFE